MIAQTIIEYNGVTFFQVWTKSFEQEAVFDDSGTDRIYSKFTIRIQGYVHGISKSALNPGAPRVDPKTAADAPTVYRHIRQALQEPRGVFRMTMGADANASGGKELLYVDPFQEGKKDLTKFPRADVNNGPKCRNISITNLAGSDFFRVECEFELCIVDCQPGENTKGVLSNRWGVTDDLDKNFKTTRTYTGRLRTVNGTLNPHDFRKWVLPPVIQFMRRNSMSFAATSDGLYLDYTIIDVETSYSAPPPATSWSLSHTEEAVDSGTVTYGSATCMLEGDTLVNKQALILVALAAVRAKIDWKIAGAEGDERGPLEYLRITDEYSDDSSRVIVSARKKRGFDAKKWQKFLTKNIGISLDLSKRFQETMQKLGHVYRSEESRGMRTVDREKIPEVSGPVDIAAILAVRLQTPCDNKHSMIVTRGEEVEPDEVAAVELIIRERDPAAGELTPFGDDPDEYVSEDHLIGLYEYWGMESTYEIDQHAVQMPIANALAGTSADSNVDTSVVVRIAPPTARRIMRVDARRYRGHPRIPTPEDYVDSNGIRATLIGKTKLAIEVPDRGPDGQQIFRTRAEFVFALSRAPTAKEKLRIGVNPWESVGMHETTDAMFGGGPENSIGTAPVPEV